MFRHSIYWLVTILSAIFLAAALMTAVKAPSAYLPLALAMALGFCMLVFSRLDPPSSDRPLNMPEKLLLFYAFIIGATRLAPSAWQYLNNSLTNASYDDDYWHLQELASLVTSNNFPPRLNFHSDSYLHFYYLPWIPAAALSDILQLLFGHPFLKLTFALDALALGIAASFILIVFIRHALAEEKAQRVTLLALILMSAGFEGILVIRNILQGVSPKIEWWQTGLLIRTEFTMWTNLLVAVPHHLIAAMAFLLSIVITTEPGGLRLRGSLPAFAAAGFLLGFSFFSSIFAFIGASCAALPFFWELRRFPKGAAVAALAFGLPSTALMYIYLHADAANGFLFFQPYVNWTDKFGSSMAGIAGLVTALTTMLIEIGWMFYLPVRQHNIRFFESRLGVMASLSFLFLLSTAFISFKEANNYAMRGAIAPSIIICCFWADAMTRYENRRLYIFLGILLILATTAQIHELYTFIEGNRKAIAFSAENQGCKDEILNLNRDAAKPLNLESLRRCQHPGSAYLLERPFEKWFVLRPDLELMGRGP